MTSNQIAYNQMLEDRRHNLIAEAETKRANLAKESENIRTNRENEAIKKRSNQLQAIKIDHDVALGTVNAASNAVKAIASFGPLLI